MWPLQARYLRNEIDKLDRKAATAFQDILPVYAQLNHEANKSSRTEV